MELSSSQFVGGTGAAGSATAKMSFSFVQEDGAAMADDTPKILLCGLQRSGKSSIQKVVFHKMSPHETLFLESTQKLDIKTIAHNSLIQFKICDFPGIHTFDERDDSLIFSKCGTLIFVIDAQEEPYADAVSFAKRLIVRAYRINPKIYFDIFIHKVDGDMFLSDEHKTECQREIHSGLTEELPDSVDAHLTFHCTSIYDHSIFEAFSKVVQNLIPQFSILEHSLDLLINNSRIEKAFLFDVISKIYIASDSQPVDMQSYELCSDMVDFVIDVSCIYGLNEEGPQSIAYDSKSSCTINLNNGTLLYLREVDRCLALVCIIREENFDRQHLVDYNIKVFKDALVQIFQA